jgi:hypothetical protein
MTRAANVRFTAGGTRAAIELLTNAIEIGPESRRAPLFAGILTKLRRRRAGDVRLTDPEIGEFAWLLDMAVHHDYPTASLRAFRLTRATLGSAVLTEV